MKMVIFLSFLFLALAGCGKDDGTFPSLNGTAVTADCPFPEESIYLPSFNKSVCRVPESAGRLPTFCDSGFHLICDAIWCWCK